MLDGSQSRAGCCDSNSARRILDVHLLPKLRPGLINAALQRLHLRMARQLFLDGQRISQGDLVLVQLREEALDSRRAAP